MHPSLVDEISITVLIVAMFGLEAPRAGQILANKNQQSVRLVPSKATELA